MSSGRGSSDIQSIKWTIKDKSGNESEKKSNKEMMDLYKSGKLPANALLKRETDDEYKLIFQHAIDSNGNPFREFDTSPETSSSRESKLTFILSSINTLAQSAISNPKVQISKLQLASTSSLHSASTERRDFSSSEDNQEPPSQSDTTESDSVISSDGSDFKRKPTGLESSSKKSNHDNSKRTNETDRKHERTSNQLSKVKKHHKKVVSSPESLYRVTRNRTKKFARKRVKPLQISSEDEDSTGIEIIELE